MSGTRREAFRFLLIGLSAVVIDFGIYRLSLWAGLPVGVSKANGFLFGTLYAYFANRYWTFAMGQARAGWAELARFATVYGVSLIVNVAVNGGVLALLGRSEIHLWVAFAVATAISAAMNFLGLKFFVFRPAPHKS